MEKHKELILGFCCHIPFSTKVNNFGSSRIKSKMPDLPMKLNERCKWNQFAIGATKQRGDIVQLNYTLKVYYPRPSSQAEQSLHSEESLQNRRKISAVENTLGFTRHVANHGQVLTSRSRVPFFFRIKLSLLKLQTSPKWQCYSSIQKSE